MPTPDIGDLKHRVTWLKAVEGPAGPHTSGQNPTSWVPRGERWAAIRELTGAELARAQQVRPTASASVRLRIEGAAAISVRDRFHYAPWDATYEIEAPNPDLVTNAWIDFLCSRKPR